MPTCVAFLRAVNVTGRFVRMTTLAQAFHTLGHADARTHIQSGNVVFTTSHRPTEALTASLEAGLEPLLGFRSEVFLRTATALQAIVGRASDLSARVGSGGEVNVCFLREAPSPDQRAALDALRTPVDDFEVHGSEVHWLCGTRQSDSRFSNAVLERRLKLRSTLRRAGMLAGLVETL